MSSPMPRPGARHRHRTPADRLPPAQPDDARRRDRGTVEIEDLSAFYGRVTAVAGVTLRVRAGERLAVVGANGSGKSTLLRVVLGLHRGATSGTVRVDGSEARTARDLDLRRRLVAYVPQRPPHGRFPLRVEELVRSSAAEDAALEAARRLGLGGLLRRPVDTLSGGQVQRAFLARAIGCVAAGATVVAADEPTSALDFEGQEEVAGVLLSLGVTTIVVTHDAGLAALCDRTVTMAAGELREGSR